MECVLSIIIPVYGVEKYLSRCLDILVAQERSLENMWGGISKLYWLMMVQLINHHKYVMNM